jgi:hypothetical protein
MNQEPATILDFLSPDLAAPDLAPAETAWRSPLERALAHAPAGVRDLSRTGKLELRGEIDGLEGVIRITPRRALVLCDYDDLATTRDQFAGSFLVLDLTAALAGLELEGEAVMRRLTDLDLDALPAVGSVSHVQTLVIRDDAETFRLFFPQEYGHSVVEIVIDALEGLR